MADARHAIKTFDKALHDRSAFSCGVDKIDNWFKTAISEQIKQKRIVVWCATNPEGVLSGFYALNTHSIVPKDAGALARRGDQFPIPVIYLPATAVASDLQGQGLGKALMGHAIRQSVDISNRAGAAALVLDVLQDDNFEKRRAFYSRIGFVQLGSAPVRMFLPLKTALVSMN
ncbi:MAG: GNAT family N-acetyltransferase [Alphaproteobacteria bacterium]|nr:GNAT family N-acetyltransferase [Alphaproteobacteria bacterium]